jgi:hypothetical protein
MRQRLPILVTSLEILNDLVDGRDDFGRAVNRAVAHCSSSRFTAAANRFLVLPPPL